MATTPSTSHPAPSGGEIDYPTGDGRPLAETPIHRDAMFRLIDVFQRWFAAEANVYVSGNMMLYYEEGNPRKHVSPDVFLVFGIPRDKPREAYFTWLEDGHAPDLAIELTSKSTRKEDEVKKYGLYQDVLQVREYFLFDPRAEYIKPRLRGYRLEEGHYIPITAVAGRLPSEVLDLHFEPDGQTLQVFNPATGDWLPTEAEAERKARLQEQEARLKAEHEVERLRQRLAEFERLGEAGSDDVG